MLDQSTENALQDLVEEFMQSGVSFTSLDITNLAKDASYRVRNHEVANWLREKAISISYDGGYLYNQSLINVDSKAVGMTLAYCYHYYKDSSDDYLDRDQNPKSFMRRVVSPTSGLLPFSNFISPICFDTREESRNFARSHSDFKFKDCGNSSPAGQRWICISR
ncbi:hypothetical protein LCGC14_1325700 [marine sediment metagenome]|uniref:Uncharacterized protein n=1 Tax=marine sediment metagenome TaxID=412755 RepID=A0A0F9MZ46_9ZZZZ